MVAALLQVPLPSEVAGVGAWQPPTCRYCGRPKLPQSSVGGCPSAVSVGIRSCRRRGSAVALCRRCCHQELPASRLATALLLPLVPSEVSGNRARRRPFGGYRYHQTLPVPKFGCCASADVVAISSYRRRAPGTALRAGDEVWRLPFCRYCYHQRLAASRLGGCHSADMAPIRSSQRQGLVADLLQLLGPS